MASSSHLTSDVSLADRICCEPSMRNEIYRFGTYHSFPTENKPYITWLAKAGFVSTHNGDEVECFSCKLRKQDWCSDDDPIEVHRALSPGCPFLLQNSIMNVMNMQGLQVHQQGPQLGNLKFQLRQCEGPLDYKAMAPILSLTGRLYLYSTR